MVKNTESGAANQFGTREKPWWQPTEAVPTFQMSGSMRALSDEKTGQASKKSTNTPSAAEQKTGSKLNSTLPSWLTDQPTSMHLPVLRGNTGQMPAAPQERSPALPKTPPTSVPASFPLSPAPGGAEWPASPQFPLNLPDSGLSTLNPSDSGLRRMNQEDAQLTGSHRAVRSNGTNPHPADAEWQMPTPLPLQGQTGQMSLVKPSGPLERTGDTLQSLAALKRNGTALPGGPRDGQNGSSPPAPIANTRTWAPPAPAQSAPAANTRTWAAPTPTAPSPNEASRVTPAQAAPAQPASVPNKAVWSTPASRVQATDLPVGNTPETSSTQSKRNYPALSAALQTLGYSVPGFIAAAVVSLDGTPIAQISVDERDISALCAQLGLIVQSASRMIEMNSEEEYEYAVITSRSQHVLLRLVGNTREVFQALITTRETEPAQSLDVMANVEAAIAAALA